MAQKARDEVEAIGSSSAFPPTVEPAPPSRRVAETESSYNPTRLSSHSPFQPPSTSSSGPHSWSVTPSGDLTWTQYFDLPTLPATSSPPSFPDSSPPGSLHSPIRIDPQTDREDDDMEIKAALPEEFSGKTRDANRWLIAMEAYFTLHEDKYPDVARTVVFLHRMSKGWGKAFTEAWLTKLKDECIADADKTWTQIKKAFKAAFTPYNAAAQAWVALASLNQDQKNSSGFDKYISFSLLSVHSGITDYHALSEWFLRGLNPQITVQLTLSGAVKASTTMEELYSKTSEIKGGYCQITSLRRGPQPSYGGGSHHHDPNAMDVDHLMLSLVKQACHMHENRCFICHKEGCSTRNHPGYNWSCPTGSWHNNSKPSQTAHVRVISTTPHSTSTPCQDDLLDSFLNDVTKTQGCDQVLCTLRSTFDSSLDEQGNPLANEQPTAEGWDESTRVLTIEVTLCISLPDHHASFQREEMDQCHPPPSW